MCQITMYAWNRLCMSINWVCTRFAPWCCRELCALLAVEFLFPWILCNISWAWTISPHFFKLTNISYSVLPHSVERSKVKFRQWKLNMYIYKCQISPISQSIRPILPFLIGFFQCQLIQTTTGRNIYSLWMRTGRAWTAVNSELSPPASEPPAHITAFLRRT